MITFIVIVSILFLGCVFVLVTDSYKQMQRRVTLEREIDDIIEKIVHDENIDHQALVALMWRVRGQLR